MKSIITLLITLSFTIIYSQNIDTTLLVDDITITQPRLSVKVNESARNVRILDKAEIATIPALNVPELLQYMGGLDIRRRGVNGVQSDAGIRGGTFNQVQVLIDGIKMNDPQTGHHMMNLPISKSDIERIEIIKGPAARIYGQNAMTGAINIITKKKNAKGEVTVDADISLGSFETVQADLSVQIPNRIYSQSISASRIGSEGYRYNTDYGINTLTYRSQLSGIGSGLQLTAGVSDRKFGANGFYADTAFVDQYEEVRTAFASGTTLFSLGQFSIKPRLSWRNNKDTYVFLRDNPSFFMNEHTSNTYNGELHTTYMSSWGTTGLGLDVSGETLVSNNLGERERTIVGLFLEHHLLLLEDRLSITAGFYGNKISDRDFKIYPGLDLSYQISNKINLFGTANWSDRIPTYTNLYYSSPRENGNENLTSESAFAVELGTKYNSSHTSLTVSAWRRHTTDLIDWYKETENQEKWQITNFNSVALTGLDLNMKHNIELGETRDINLTLDYSYIHSQVEDNVEFPISRYSQENLRHQLILGLTTYLIPERLSLSTYLRYGDRTNDSQVPLADFTLLDSKLMYTSRSADVYLGIRNITDTRYRETNLVLMPGRAYTVGIAFKSL